MKDALSELYEVVLERKSERQEGSYTCYLFSQGLDKILKKVGEESTEVIIAAKADDKKETIKAVKQKNEIILYLTDHASAKSADIAELLDVKSTRVKKLLSELISEGVVVAEGGNRNRTYKLKS